MALSSIRITWREGFMLLAGFTVTALALTALLFNYNLGRHERLVGEWTELFERCRTAIEMRVPLVTTALTPMAGNGDPMLRVDEDTTLYSYGGSRFAILFGRSGTGDDANYSCDVVLADWSLPLDEDEMAALLWAFVAIREKLSAAGTHEFREHILFPPATVLSFGPRERNPAGCNTIAAVFVEMQDRSFSTMIGEQGIDCIRRSQLG